jgi:hypothetical protein
LGGGVSDVVNYTPPGPIAEAFLECKDFVTGLRGPVGSGKSSAACWKMVKLALAQKPFNGTRYSRWAVLRNTYPELKSTTIKTWQDWFPNEVAPFKWDTPITSHLKVADIGDGTALDMEVLFMAMDRPEDAGKLKSLELTGGWANEASELDKGVIDVFTSRVGRYPAKRRGGPSWSGVFMDTNSPDDDSWWYKLAEEGTPDGWKFFSQPGALYRDESGLYLPNHLAENIQHIPNGYQYYMNMLSGKSDDWIKVFILNQYGSTMSGKPVYPEWKEDFHLAKEPLQAIMGLPLILGWDFGLTPACAIFQMTPKGQLLMLREYASDGMGIRQFSTEVVRPALLNEFPRHRYESVGDPAGTQRAQTDEKTCMQELLECGIPTEPAPTNEFVARREAVAFWLTRAVAGQPSFLVDPSCKMTRKGFNGGYHYERVNATGSTRYKDRPSKNKFSHIHDAIQYACLHVRSGLNPVRVMPVTKRSSKGWT